MVQKVLSELVRYKNGMVSESMARLGIEYKRNYGVSILDIKRVAAKYGPDHNLAMQLFERPIRETRLAAIYVADPLLLTNEQIDFIGLQFTNPEMVEQACMMLLWKSPLAMAFAYEWLDTDNEFKQKAAWMLLGKLPQAAWTSTFESDILPLLNKSNHRSIHVRSALIYALPILAARSDAAQRYISFWCSSLASDPEGNLLAGELKSFMG